MTPEFIEHLRPRKFVDNARRHILAFFGTDQGTTFAAAFFFCSVAIYIFPLIMAWRLAFDSNVDFWFGRFPFWVTLPIPLVFVVVYILHIKVQRPKRPYMLASFIIPSVTFFMVGSAISYKSIALQDRLLSVDCKVLPRFREIYQAAEDARRLYKKCNPNGERILFQVCPEYDKWSQEVEDRAEMWRYLQFVEGSNGCSGFCTAGTTSLWHFPDDQDVRDACAPCVASVMRTKIDHTASQLKMYSVIVLFSFLAWLFICTPSLRRIGSQRTAGRSLEGKLASIPPAGKPRAFIAAAAPAPIVMPPSPGQTILAAPIMAMPTPPVIATPPSPPSPPMTTARPAWMPAPPGPLPPPPPLALPPGVALKEEDLP